MVPPSKGVDVSKIDTQTQSQTGLLTIGGWEIHTSRNLITKFNQSTRLEPRTMAVLMCLSEKPGEVITRQQLENIVWQEVIVSYDSLSNAIGKLRKAFGDDRKKPQFIETIPKVGYRLIAEVDHSIPENVTVPSAKRPQRKFATILYAEATRCSHLIGQDENAIHRDLSGHLEFIVETAAFHRGQIKHCAGDAVLALFSTEEDALSAALAIQTEIEARNDPLPDEHRVRFRVGVNSGEVIDDHGDVYGDGVDVVTRLEALAEPGGVCISDATRTAIGSKLRYEYVFIGEHSVKNVNAPVRAYKVFQEGTASATSTPSLPGWSGGVIPRQFGKPSIAVKPFLTISTDIEHEHLADGLTNGIIIALTRVPALTHVEDTSPSMIESRGMTISELGQRFQVQYVLKGNFQKYGDRIRVSAELVETATGKIIWAENLDRILHDYSDFFALQDDISNEIITALDVKLLSGEAARLVRRTFEDPVALEHYARGEELLYRAELKLEFREAARLFNETIRLQPKSPVGYAAAALTHWMEVVAGLSDVPDQTLEQAAELARKAIDLEDVTGYAHLVLAHVHLHERDFEKAIAEATSAVSDRPSCPTSYTLKAAVLIYVGQPDEAIEFAQYAVRLSPIYPPMFPAILATAFYGSGRYDEAITASNLAIGLRATDVDPYLVLAASNMAMDRPGQARSAAEEVIALVPNFNLADFAETQPYREQKHLNRLLDHLRSAGLQ